MYQDSWINEEGSEEGTSSCEKELAKLDDVYRLWYKFFDSLRSRPDHLKIACYALGVYAELLPPTDTHYCAALKLYRYI